MKKIDTARKKIVLSATMVIFATLSSTATSSIALAGASCENSFVNSQDASGNTPSRSARLRSAMMGLMTGKSSPSQSVREIPSSLTLKEFISKASSSTPELDNGHFSGNGSPAINGFWQSNLANLYQALGKDQRYLVSLIRLNGTPVTENRVGNYRGGSVLETDAPIKIASMVLKLNNAEFNPDLSTYEIAQRLNLNRSYIRVQDGMLMVEEQSGSTSGMGIVNPGVHQPGLLDIKQGKVPGMSAIEISYDNSLDSGSVWGGRYSSTTISAVVAMDAAKYAEARANLGPQLAERGLQTLSSNRITDTDLQNWLGLVTERTLQSQPWSDALRSAEPVSALNLRIYSGQPVEFKNSLVQFLFARGVLNFKPTELYEYAGLPGYPQYYLDGANPMNIKNRGPVVDSVKYFRNDRPYMRTGANPQSLEIFGHLRATHNQAMAANEASAAQVEAYVRATVPQLFANQQNVAEFSNIQFTSEGQFTATVTVRPRPSFIRRLIGQ